MTVHLFGIRHHGPGSARSLHAALHALAPDCVLIEGPPDADALIPLSADPAMAPPVALLVYQADQPQRAAFFPYAIYSPEWVALTYAVAAGVPVRFMDLPQAVQFAQGEAPEEPMRHDPMGEMARAAGYADGEAWWDALVESRATPGADVFAAVADAMAALRDAMPDEGEEAKREERREAHMRATLRDAVKGGAGRVAAVCGAWHVPALARHAARGQAAADALTLKGLPRVKTAAAWAPWSYARLASSSGYRAGVLSPEWYDLLWHTQGGVAAPWLSRAAGLLRAEDLDASTASVIEAVRLADSLAALRGRDRPALAELDDACAAALLFADPAPMALIRRKLVIGERLGRVPEGAAHTPLQADLAAETRRLRLPPAAAAHPLDLDLRKDTDLGRSRLLHRLRLLDVPWGTPRRTRGSRGTFREEWMLDWQPEFAVELVAASMLGATVADAAGAAVARRAAEATTTAGLAGLVGMVADADLPAAASAVLHALADRAALATDVFDLMDALPPLAELARYGSVRGAGGADSPVGAIVAGIVPRVAAGLLPACLSLDDEAAAAAKARLDRVAGAVTLLEQPPLQAEWTAALRRLADAAGVHGRVSGRATRLLLDGQHLDAGEAGQRLGLALSPAVPATEAAAWFEGFIEGSGTVLLHDAAVLGLVDAWLGGLAPERFVEVLPLLRRSFATVAAGERRLIGERVRGGVAAKPGAGLDPARAARVLPVLQLLLGARHG